MESVVNEIISDQRRFSGQHHVDHSGDGSGQFCNMNSNPNAVSIQLSIGCENLRERDVFSRASPACVLSIRSRSGRLWRKVGRTEVIKNCKSPKWVTAFHMEYLFEERQELHFAIYDWADESTENLHKQDLIASFDCYFAEIIRCHGSRFVQPLVLPYSNQSSGSGESPSDTTAKIVINIEQQSEGMTDFVEFELAASNLDKKDLFSESDPFFTVNRQNLGNDATANTLVYRSEWIKNKHDPQWKTCRISTNKLCGGDWDRKLTFEIYDHDSDGQHDYIGSFETSLSEMASGEKFQILQWQVINQSKKDKPTKDYKNSGSVILKSIKIEQDITFVDYLRGGLDLHLIVAVDFTASNGDPRHPSSLHYYDGQRPENPYTMAMKSIGEIFQDYKTSGQDTSFTGLGFGGMVNGQLHNCFPLNGDVRRPECHGVEGLVQAYYHTLNTVSPAVPTSYAPTIDYVRKLASTIHENLRVQHTYRQQYYVLLIITDGGITDLEETKRILVDSSHLPYSIILLGVGRGDMTKMDILDDDQRVMSVNGKYAERDVVQFVQMCKYLPNANLDPNTFYSLLDADDVKYQLAKDVLAEIPGQVVQYFKQQGVKPIKFENAQE